MERKNSNLIDSHTGITGEIEAYASVFDTIDRTNERVSAGAFTRTLREWRGSGKELPIVASHKWDDPWAVIGSAHPENVRETTRGLLVKGVLDIEDNPLAAQVHKLMKRGNLTAWSFGYTIPAGGSRHDKDGVKIIKEVDLHEVGPCLVGANADAQLVGVKGHATPEADEPQIERKSGPIQVATVEIG